MASFTVNPQSSFGQASTERLAEDKTSGLSSWKSEKKVWKIIALSSFIVAIFGLVLSVFGYLQTVTITQNTGDIKSCKFLNGKNGVYYIQPDMKVDKFPVYCDMESVGGGWTLVAAVHENNIDGKCTLGDNWSSDQGFSTRSSYDGSRNWENINVFGSLLSLTDGDYKNIAYYAVKGEDVMVWHVPNNTPIPYISSQAFLKYHTTNGFLRSYGGTLQSLYSNYVPLIHAGTSRFFTLVAPPVAYLRGNNTTIMAGIPEQQKDFVEPGFLQFRAFDEDGFPNALCPGVRMTKGNSARVCIGGGGAPIHAKRGAAILRAKNNCGDFAGWKGDGRETSSEDVPSRSGRSLRDINSSIFIFIR